MDLNPLPSACESTAGELSFVPSPDLEQFYVLRIVCSSGSRYKSVCVFLKVEREDEALALLFAPVESGGC